MVSIIVAVITTSGVIINTIISNKINKKINSIDDLRRENDKTYLTDFLAELENGQPKSEIQIKRAYEIYEEYTNLKGNSYVHNKWEELVKKGVL